MVVGDGRDGAKSYLPTIVTSCSNFQSNNERFQFYND